ncbi:MAG: GntR family transcriptional regulator [Planctomycetota bacterium]|jgi:DNA-binding transcriptional regulator YhcF (GntR family)
MSKNSLQSDKKYETIARQIEEQLREEGLQQGDRLPSVVALSKRFNVAPLTLRNALRVLEEKDILEAVAKKGIFVKQSLADADTSEGEISSESKNSNSAVDVYSPVSSIFVQTVKELNFYADEWAAPAQRPLWERLCKTIESMLGNVRINMLPSCDAYNFIGGSGVQQLPDVFTVSHPKLPRFRTAGALASLGNLWQSMQPEEQFFRVSLDALGASEEIDVLPFSVSACLQFVNTKLLNDLNSSHNKEYDSEKLFEELIKDPSPEKLPLCIPFIHMLTFGMLEAGIPLVDNRNKNYCWDADAVAKVLGFNKHMYSRSKEILSSRPMRTDLLWDTFFKGDVLFMNTFSYALSHFNKQLKFTEQSSAQESLFKVLPSRSTCPGWAPSTSVGMAVSALSENSDYAKEFIALACGDVGQGILAEEGASIPASIKAARSADFMAHCPAGMDKVLDSFVQSRSMMRHWACLRMPFSERINTLVLPYYDGEVEKEELLKTLKSDLGDCAQAVGYKLKEK